MIDKYHNLEDILYEVEWYVERTVFEDEEKMEQVFKILLVIAFFYMYSIIIAINSNI